MKFQFAEDDVTFLGFKITKIGLGPTDSFLETISSFPSPKFLSDVRSWFGTINQISYAFAAAGEMAPFRSLLSSKLPFCWSDELEAAFQHSKAEILRQCCSGVRKFDPTKNTALATDWSRQAVGCWLTQQFCSCSSDVPRCCPTGWQTVHVSSQFNSPGVSNYHPIEGEAHAAIWALDKCKFFVLGIPRLTLPIDHKPLLAILGQNQELHEVINPRLLNLKLKRLAFRFKPMYIPGKRHVVPDAFSRRNDAPAATAEKLPKLPPPVNNVGPHYELSFGPPQWVSGPKVTSLACEESSENLYRSQAFSMVAAVASTLPTDAAANNFVVRYSE